MALSFRNFKKQGTKDIICVKVEFGSDFSESEHNIEFNLFIYSFESLI